MSASTNTRNSRVKRWIVWIRLSIHVVCARRSTRPPPTTLGVPSLQSSGMPRANGSTYVLHHATTSASLVFAPRSLAVCLFGVPGVHTGKAFRTLSLANHGGADAVYAAAQCASNHIKFIIGPAESAGMTVRVFAHSWGQRNSSVARVIDASYGHWLAGSLHEPHNRLSKMRSMACSIARSLRLARDASALKGKPFDLVLLMRHDTFWIRPLCLNVSPHVFTTATWCNAPVRQARGTAFCGPLSLANHHGLHDYWFVGGQVLLEYIFGSLEARLLSGENLGRIPTSAHFAIQAHCDDLRLGERALLNLHAGAVSYAHFTLFRWRKFSLQSRFIPPPGCHQTVPCDGRTVCLHAVGQLPRLPPRDIGPWT